MRNLSEVILQPEYDFLRSNKLLGNNIMFLTFGGSYSYGTEIPGKSDIDIRGCALNQKSDIIGLTSFDQVIDGQTDTTIYAINKLVKLLIACNPNCIELLFGRPEYYANVSKDGQLLLDNRKLFLSQNCVRAFGGYASQQLNRLGNAIARDRMQQSEVEEHILRSCESAMAAFNDRYREFDKGAMNIYVDEAESEGLDSEIFVDVNLHHYPLRDYKSMFSDLSNIVKDYGKLSKRNHKKDDEHINKHAMHLIRLYIMCNEILETGDVNTYREKEHDLLMSIRNGAYMDENGLMKPEFFELLQSLEDRFAYAKSNTCIPAKPDIGKIEEILMEINKSSIT